MAPSHMRPALVMLAKGLVSLLVLAVVLLLVLALQARNRPDLSAWHRWTFPAEVKAADVGAGYRWRDYLQAEREVFDQLARQQAAADLRGQYRYQRGSLLGARRGEHDWNRSYESTPAAPRGGVLLLHGLSDGPYSMRHLAARYEQAGFAVIVPRLPGHGTAPSALLDVRWQDWAAVVRLAAKALRARIGAGKPLHVVGYSNGGALALDYAMEVAGDNPEALPRADRLVLLSPMIGVGHGARLAWLLPVFGGMDYFEKSKWLDVLPEFNPFKYNSFPINGAVQSYELSTHVQAGVLRLQSRGRLPRLPPILAFQSVLDSTVSTGDVVHALFEHLPANGSELVLFDLNRGHLLAPLLTPEATGFTDTLRLGKPRDYRLSLVANLRPDTLAVGERSYAPRNAVPRERALGLSFPADVYSLSHVALPFPMDDALYGLQPRTDQDYGVRLGTLSLHGERGALVVKADQLQRLNCNPFFPYLVERIGATLPPSTAASNSGSASRSQ